MTIGSGSCPTLRGPDHRYGSRCPALDGERVPPRDADDRGQFGGGGPHGAGTPAGDPEAAATRREARGAAPVGARPVTHLRIQALRSRLPDGHAKLRILRDVDRAHACIPLRAILRFLRVAGSVSGVAPTAGRVYARRSVVLSTHVTPPTDALRGPGDQRHGHLARVVPTEKSIWHAQHEPTVD